MSFPAVPLEIPKRLRAFVRAHESSLIVLAAVVGAGAGLVVAGMGAGVDLLHALFFGLEPGQRLSGSITLNPVYAFATPFLGGIVLGLANSAIKRWRPNREVDPIEANALHGGRMSLRGSLTVAAQTVWSSGVGASVGLEAGYTQLASGIASRIGQAFRLRRRDLRVLVGCGAAGGIAGAFGAPLAGAFYAFELIIGSYSIANVAPVAVAAVIGYLVARAFSPAQIGILAPAGMTITTHDLLIAAVLGLIAAVIGIALMRGVALCESLFARLHIRPALRPGIGGFLVGLLAMVSPQVMSSGHGALHLASVLDRPVTAIALVFVLKALASIVSLGSGFRGGLFFASLLIGGLGGHLFAGGLAAMWTTIRFDPDSYAVIGMSSFAVAVIGGPLTMVFIALETTGDLWLTTAVLIAVLISAQTTRETFGYSFATWRFHLRGETIRSAADIGWIRDLTVGRMMRQDVRTVLADTTVAAFCEAFPLGSTGQVVAVDEHGRYVGMAIVAEVHAPENATTASIRALLRLADEVLLPEMNVRQAVAAFDRAEAEALAVIDSMQERRVIGQLSEAHALRRYAEELELRRRELTGEALGES
jgi:chloride channel protein, CIC family